MARVNRRQAAAVSLAAAMGMPWLLSAAAAEPTSGVVRYGNERRYRVTHLAEIDVGDVALRSLEIWIPVPMAQPEQQVRSVKIEPEVPVVRDAGGQAAVARLYLTEGLPGPVQSVRLRVSYEIASREIAVDRRALEKYRFRAYRKDEKYHYFTRPEKKIEVAQPAIAEQATSLRGRNPLEIARAAYDRVLDRTEYKLVNGLKGAVYCLANRHGECGDYSALFVALCRAAGVPARPVAGFWADQTDQWHCWAEFMLPGGEWIPVDPAIGDQNPTNRERYFGGLDNRRATLCKTYDVVLAGPSSVQRTCDFLQVGAWWWFTSTSFEGKRTPKAKFTVTGKTSRARGCSDDPSAA
jgi:transglutaminase-like putative cysteine protease